MVLDSKCMRAIFEGRQGAFIGIYRMASEVSELIGRSAKYRDLSDDQQNIGTYRTVGGFLRKCHVQSGGRFINAPMPRSMKLSTVPICSPGN